MTFEEDIDNAYSLAEFFWNLNEKTETDYASGKISKKKRNQMIKLIRVSRNQTMAENDPITKNNPLLREIADNFKKFRKVA